MINDSVLNNREACLEFLKVFKAAQIGLQADAEAVEPVIHAIEELGKTLYKGKGKNLGAYIEGYCSLIAPDHPSYQEFVRLYDNVRENRNNHVHQGAAVRSFAAQASKLANLISRELMTIIAEPLVKDLMIETIIVAKPWHPLRKIRHLMLVNGITALPYWIEGSKCDRWHLITDFNLHHFTKDDANLKFKCSEVFDNNLDRLEVADLTDPELLVKYLIFSSALPKLVVSDINHKQELVGIISASDVL